MCARKQAAAEGLSALPAAERDRGRVPLDQLQELALAGVELHPEQAAVVARLQRATTERRVVVAIAAVLRVDVVREVVGLTADLRQVLGEPLQLQAAGVDPGEERPQRGIDVAVRRGRARSACSAR